MRKSKKYLLFLLIFSAILALFAILERLRHTYVLYPTRSTPHTLTFVSYAKYYIDPGPVITLRQYDQQNEPLCESRLSITSGIAEQEIQKYSFPEWIGESVDLCVNLYDKEPPLPVIHFPSTSELEENGVLIYLLNDTELENTDGLLYLLNDAEQYAYFVSGKHWLVFFWADGSDCYEQVSDAPRLRMLPPYHSRDYGAFPGPRAGWKEHTWVTTSVDD